MIRISFIGAATLACATAQTPLLNANFEASPFDQGWTNSGAAVTAGFAPGSSQAARFSGSGQSLKQAVTWSPDWHLEFSFMIQNTANRQLSVIIETGPGTPTFNLRYQGGWQAFSGGWGGFLALDPLLASFDQNTDGDCDDAGDTKNVYRMRITGHDWGSASARCDLSLSDPNGIVFTSNLTGLTRFQSAPTSQTPSGFKFSTEFGSNPGFWLDDVSTHDSNPEPSSSIDYFVATGNTLSWQSSGTGSLTLNPGNIDVTGLSSYNVSPLTTTTYTLTTGSESRTFTIGVGEPNSPLVLNEFLAINPVGDDWIELHNPNNFSLNLTDYALTDNAGNLDKFLFPPTAIQPGEFLILDSGDLGFSLSGSGEYLALLDLNGTILTEFAPLYPSQYPGVSYGLSGNSYTYLGTPSPGAPNIPTPFLTNPGFIQNPDGSHTVSVLAGSASSTLSSVTLHYRAMFDSETTLAMTPQGANIFSATIPSNIAEPGEMLRWRINVTDSAAASTKLPLFPDANSPEYFGTVIPDSSLSTQLPVFQWFLPPASFAAADTRTGTRCSLFWQGEFYDNVLVHLRGATTSTLEKKPHQFEANPGHDFLLHPDAPRVDQINVNAAYPDSSYLRDVLPMGNLHQMGIPTPETFPIRVQRNGDFHSLGIMVEQPDNEFLNRHDDLLDPDGAFFKATGNGSWLASATGFQARNNSNLAELTAFTSALNGVNQLDFLLENTDLPSLVNYLAVNVVDSIFNPQKNYYLHQNRFGEWMIIPWDRDFSYGHRWLGSGDPRGPAGPTGFLVTNERYEWGGSNHDFKGGYNRLFDAIFDNATTSEMFYRRLRSSMDTILAPGILENRIEEYRILMKQEADLDRSVWGFTNNGNYRRFPRESFDTALNRIKNTYLPARRAFLENNGGTPVRGSLPTSQPSTPAITFGQLISNPASGDQDDETIELENPNSYAVDVSNWTLDTAISHTLRPGTVIPAGQSLVLSPDIQSYRAQNPPAFAQGNYQGHLSNFSETLNLRDQNGALIASITTPDLPSDNQRYLVISEIMYHPSDDVSEFVELLNTSDAITLNLGGVSFTQGISYTFPTPTTLPPGQRIVINFTDFDSGRLGNGGETLKLDDSDGSTISEFRFDDSAPWPTSPDGAGTSLVFRGGNPALPQNWRASISSGGTPGGSDTIPYTGGNLLEYALACLPEFNHASATLTVIPRQGADDVELIPQWSNDLLTWHDNNIEFSSSQPMQWTVPKSTPKNFFRILVRLR